MIPGPLPSLHLQGISRLAKLTVAGLFALIVVLSFQQIYSPDIGFHLKGGAWIVEHRSFPSTDPFTYTASTHEYVDLHWMYQVLIFTVDTFAGEFGLVLLNSLLLLMSFGILLLRSVRKAPLSRLSSWHVMFFLAVWTVSYLFEVRPHVLSWVYLNLLLLLLEEYYDGRSNYLWWIPLLMLLWTNSHSLFVMGWLILGCFALGTCVRDQKFWTPLVPVTIVSVAVSFLNPYFLRGIALPFQQFGFLHGGNVFKETIGEYASPMNFDFYTANGHFTIFQPLLPFHLFFLLVCIAFLFRLKKITFHELLLFLFFGYLAVKGLRNIGNFVFVVFPATVYWLQKTSPSTGDAVEGRTIFGRIRDFWNSGSVQIACGAVTIVVSALFILAAVNGSYYISFRSNRRFGYRYSKVSLPVEAASFIVDKKLSGRILNDFGFGGYFINTLPQQVYMDGRNEVIGESLYLEYSRMWRPVDKQPLLDKYKPEIVAFPYQQEFLWVHFLKGNPQWRLAHVDPMAAVYVTAKSPSEVAAVDSLFYTNAYHRIDESRIDSILSDSSSRGNPLFSFREHYYPLSELDLSTFCYYNDWFDAAVQIGLNGLERTTVDCPEMFYNLGHYFFEKKDFRRSAACYRRFLKTNTDGLAEARVAGILSGQIPGAADSASGGQSGSRKPDNSSH
ncbi:MAG TPA: hypothetical protein VL633_07390 [Bacteroidota bacterium]|nr:hypothetical protein [Bacteroidota bacterium]